MRIGHFQPTHKLLREFTFGDQQIIQKVEFGEPVTRPELAMRELLHLWGRHIPVVEYENGNTSVKERHRLVVNLNAFRVRAKDIAAAAEGRPVLARSRDELIRFSNDLGFLQLTKTSLAAVSPKAGETAASSSMLVLRPNSGRGSIATIGQSLRNSVNLLSKPAPVLTPALAIAA
jgi:hypothetical protein